eukprot:EG_transcript_6353
MYSAMANEVIRISAFRDAAKKEFWSLIDKVKDSKVLALDPTLIGALQAVGVGEGSALREKGVNQLFRVTEQNIETDCKSVVYVVRPKMKMMKIIAKHIRHLEKHPDGGGPKQFFVFLVPRRTEVCRRILEDEGVLGSVQALRELEIDLIPLDDDVMTMELDSSFRECFLDGDCSSLYYVARSIVRIQAQFGPIPEIRGKGRCAKQAVQMMQRMKQELGPDFLKGVAPQIHQLYVLDRDVDLVTPFVTQLTYEGLIDEIWGIKTGIFDPPFPLRSEDAGKPGTAPKRKKVGLNANDKVFVEVRDQNFSSLGAKLNAKAIAIESALEQRHEMKEIIQIRDFMRKLPELQQEKESLATHIVITQEIKKRTSDPQFMKRIGVEQNIYYGEDEKGCMDYVEDCIGKQDDLRKVLRLLALFSAVNGGLKPKVLDFFRREIMQTYGFEAMLLLDNLEKAGILRRQEGRSNFPTLKKALRLLVRDIDESNPSDIAYVYSGYAPMSVRLVEAALKPGGWRAIEAVLSALPGPLVEDVQSDLVDVSPGTKVVMLLFIGGITFAEIAAIRFLNEQLRGNSTENAGRLHFLICTTHIVNGSTLLESLFDKLGAIQ